MSSVGLTDTASIVKAGGHSLSYNGVSYTPAAVQHGTYSHWEFEHCYRLTSQGDNTTVGHFANLVADLVFAVDADAVYNAATVTAPDLTTSIGVFHTEDPATGIYTTKFGLAPGVVYDGFVTVTRSTTEGGPISSGF
jgi:hypothetical protein